MGWGGHDAGDVASRTVNQIVTDWIIKIQVLPDLRKATRKLITEYLFNKVGQDLGHKPVILSRSAAEAKNLALDRRFGHCNVRFFASLRSAQNDTGMIIWLPPNIEKIHYRGCARRAVS